MTFAYIAAPSVAMALFIGFVTITNQVAGTVGVIPWASRVLLAMSFDRTLPSALSDISERFHTPVKALAVSAIVAILAIPFWVYAFVGTVVNMSIVFGFIYLIGGIAAIVFPYAKKDIFKASPANYRVGGIPVLSLLGIATTAAWVVLLYVAVTSNLYGPIGFPSYSFTVGLFVSGLVLFFLIKAYRKSKGTDIMLTFKEIPPE